MDQLDSRLKPRLFEATLSLVAIGFYFLANVQSLGVGVAYGALVPPVFLCVLWWARSWSLDRRIFLSSKLLFASAFFLYFLLRLFATSDDLYFVRQLTVGTTGGVLFSFGLGVVSGSTVQQLRRSCRRRSHMVETVVYFAGAVGLLFVFLHHLRSVRTDLFLIDHSNSLYQRPGDMLIMFHLLLVVISSALQSTSFGTVMIVSFLSTCAMLLSQLIGSNLAFVVIGGATLVFVGHSLALRMSGRSEDPFRSVRRPSKLESALIHNVAGLIIVSVALFLAAVVLRTALMRQLGSLRITGFGTGVITSVESRIAIFRQNFIRHLSFSPLLGHTRVEIVSGTGPGTYVHSFASVATHLGAVGFALFLVVIFGVARRAKRRGRRCAIDAHRHAFLVLMLLFFTGMGFVGVFFAWMPFWFLVGILTVRSY